MDYSEKKQRFHTNHNHCIDFALAFANDFDIWNLAFDKYLRSSSETLATFWAEFGGIYNTKLEELMAAVE